MVAVAGTFGGSGGGGGGVSLSAVIEAGETASDFNSGFWFFNANTCAASGGTAPYSYSWAWSGPGAIYFSFNGSSTLSTCEPIANGVPAINEPFSATLTCTVTDAAATVVASNGEVYRFTNIT